MSHGATQLLRVAKLSAGFSRTTVLERVDLEVPRTGVLGLLGPAGVGKSTLLRTIGRLNEALPSFWVDGEISWSDGSSQLCSDAREVARARAPLLAQKAGLYTATVLENAIAAVRDDRARTRDESVALARRVLEPLDLWSEYRAVLFEPVLSLSIGRQRKLSLARLISGGARCVLADEPFRDIDERDADAIAELLRAWTRRHAAIVVTHDQTRARSVCDTVALMTAGRIVEAGACDDFFAAPRTALGRDFLRLGNCWPDANEVADALRDELPAPRVPSGFHWVIDGLLGGTQQPGLLGDVADDIAALRELGCRILVTLTESPFDPARVRTPGLELVHFPIPDMHAPAFDDAVALCSRLSDEVDRGMTTVLHCRAGLGRTGTMLACILVWRGATAVDAVDRVRGINPYYIQSRSQLDFVCELERRLAAQRAR